MRVLKQSTAATVLLGPFLDKTDGVTEESGLATTGTEISKAGGAFAAGPTLGTHDSDGWYPISLTTTHTNTLGDLTVKVHDAATHLPVWAHFTVLPANVYDSLVAGSDALQVHANEITAGLITATAIATGAIDADALAADAAAEIADAVWDEDATGHQTGGTFGQAIGDPGADTNTIFKAVVTDATGATVGVDVAAVLADTGTDGVVVASINANAITAAATAADFTTEVTSGLAQETTPASIKTQTDKLTFTVANQVDANIQSVNDVTVTGTGAAGSEWGP